LRESKNKGKTTIRAPVSEPVVRAENIPTKENNTVGQYPGLAKIAGLSLDTKPKISIDLDFAKDILKPIDKQIDNTKDINIWD
jgi:hypothetical protein